MPTFIEARRPLDRSFSLNAEETLECIKLDFFLNAYEGNSSDCIELYEKMTWLLTYVLPQ